MKSGRCVVVHRCWHVSRDGVSCRCAGEGEEFCGREADVLLLLSLGQDDIESDHEMQREGRACQVRREDGRLRHVVRTGADMLRAPKCAHRCLGQQHPTARPRPRRSAGAIASAHGNLPGTAFPATGAPPQGARKPKKKKKKKQHVRFTPSGQVPGDEPPPPGQHHTATVAGVGAAGTASVVYHHGAGAADPSYSPSPAAPPPAHGYGSHAYAYSGGYGRYAPSPLPRWEMLGTPRRHEYFSSEYRWYYPTPVREGIYSFATDANGRLSTIFSEENPNACTIV